MIMSCVLICLWIRISIRNLFSLDICSCVAPGHDFFGLNLDNWTQMRVLLGLRIRHRHVDPVFIPKPGRTLVRYVSHADTRARIEILYNRVDDDDTIFLSVYIQYIYR